MQRRDFLKAAAAGGYSLVVFADEGAASPPGPAGGSVSASPTPPASAASDFPIPEAHMRRVELECDLFVAGGGLSGVCAALAAARHGAKVVLVQDRSRLGGNSSSEVRMHVVGADSHGGRAGWREGGIIEELRLDDAVGNPQRCFELWDLLLYDKVTSEPNITLLLDTTLYAAEVKGGRIERVAARCDKTEHLYSITARTFADCTGDGRLALESGAGFRWGHEAREEFDELLGWDEPSLETLGSSILFTSTKHEKPMPFQAPSWARKITKKQLLHRGIGSWEYGYWWIEWGGMIDTIADGEQIRHELLAIVLGVWDYIKNSGDHPSSENWALDWIGMVPGKRESRRIEGAHILTQQDLVELSGRFEDAVAIGGWGLDEHPPGGFDATEEKPFDSTPLPDVYNIPLRSLYSRDVANLMMAGRNASCSHVAFTSTRVMATCAVMGQALGTAAALCAELYCTPAELYADEGLRNWLQQRLLRDDQTIKHLKNEDPLDLARQATVIASATHENALPEHLINGFVRDRPGRWDNRWAAPMTGDGPWVVLAWEEPQRLSQVQITFDSGFHRELTLSASDGVTRRVIRGPQPETVRDYEIEVRDARGRTERVAEVRGNHQRLRRHRFEAVEVTAVRVHVTATNGSEQARVFEVRCYA